MTIHSIVIQKLLSTNAQVGRRVAAHHFKLYTYGFRNKMAIIDSDKTLICMRSACNFMASLARQNGRFMFINTNPLFDDIFDLMTQKVGSYRPSANALWRTGGFLTNSYSPKKFRSRHKKLIFGPTQPPDCIVIIDTERKSSVINEAFKLQIPVVALVDSAMPLHSYKRIAYPVPANDSVQFVYLFCNLITKTLLLEKKNSSATLPKLDAGEEAPQIEGRKGKSDLAKVGITVVPYANLAPPEDMEETKKLLDKLVVVKFDGPSGRSLGLDGPKSAIDISDGLTFLDLIINQIENLNSKYGCRVPLLLFNKGDTYDNTLKVLEKYSKSSVEVHTFKQGEGPESKLSGGHYSKDEVHSFDDVDMFHSLMTGGTLDSLLSQGKEYILVMKSDNVAAIIDPNILNHLMMDDIEYCMEVTPGNRLNSILSPMNFKLKEIALNQDKHLRESFKLIDTTNMWVSLRAIKRLVDSGELMHRKPSDSKENDNDQTLLQDTAGGPAIQLFDNVIGVSVPESRYLPLDTTSDLLILQSDLYTCREGALTRNPDRTSPSNPVIDLGPEFEKVDDFRSRFRSIPSIIDLDSLTVRGDVWFGANITLKGFVTITAKPGVKLEIPEGVIIDNKEINDPADI